MDWKKVGAGLVSLMEKAPGYIGTAVTIAEDVYAIYTEVKDNLDETDSAKIDAAYEAAKAADKAATEKAGAALDEAAKS